MADGTKIEWTDATWNPITGCAVVSPGCTNCYAMKLAGTRLKHHPSRAGLTRETKAGPVWTGEVRFNEAWLDQPLRWAKPRMIFVCAHGDLFAEGVPDEWIDRVFAVMALAPRHTFQVLTKRAERMQAYFAGCTGRTQVSGYSHLTTWHRREGVQRAIGEIASAMAYRVELGRIRTLPLPNVWLGVSAEDQRRADERVPLLLDTPAEVRWVSAEPLIGPIDFHSAACRDHGSASSCPVCLGGLDWIVAGGESGHGARPMHPIWVRAIRDQCAAAGVVFLFKQWGAWASLQPGSGSWLTDEANFCRLRLDGSRGDDGWPMQRVGKKVAGRLLDGVTHDGFPEVQN